MRDFGATPEPASTSKKSKAPRGKLRFVVQKHAASHLHYDFRLEAQGVLMSWAVPKGPTLVAGERRLAMQTEDHPRDYFDFEGVIPEGNYGAGHVIVWDWGTYELVKGDDAYREMERGRIEFVLHGEKLRGKFLLVKMKGRGGPRDNAWLLFKAHDDEEKARFDVEKVPRSVKTGMTLEEVAGDRKKKTWISNRAAARSARAPAPARARVVKKIDRVPKDPRPMLTTLIDAPFDDPDWLFEIKWDGFRAIAVIDERGGVTMTSRNGKDLLARFPQLEAIAGAFRERPVVIDGEIVSMDPRGRSSFQRLQGSPADVQYVVFDALYAHGKDLRGEPLEARKRILEEILGPKRGGLPVVYSKHVIGEGTKLFELARSQELEGIIGKRRDSRYVDRRTKDWVKIKVKQEQEFVVGGFTDPKGGRKGFGSLLLGVHRKGEQKLVYAGDVGTGFSSALLTDLHRRLAKLETTECPFSTRPKKKGIHWVRPTLVAEVAFTEWTDDGRLRHPAFQGLRDDKDPKDVVRESPRPAKDVER